MCIWVEYLCYCHVLADADEVSFHHQIFGPEMRTTFPRSRGITGGFLPESIEQSAQMGSQCEHRRAFTMWKATKKISEGTFGGLKSIRNIYRIYRYTWFWFLGARTRKINLHNMWLKTSSWSPPPSPLRSRPPHRSALRPYGFTPADAGKVEMPLAMLRNSTRPAKKPLVFEPRKRCGKNPSAHFFARLHILMTKNNIHM